MIFITKWYEQEKRQCFFFVGPRTERILIRDHGPFSPGYIRRQILTIKQYNL